MSIHPIITALRISFEYLVSTLIWSIFTPYGLAQTFRQISGQLAAISRALSQGVTYNAALSCRLPFAGAWKVVNGGMNAETSHSWSLIGQRYAYDFVIVDESGQSYQGDARRPESYRAFGQPILAAADGVVTAVRDDIRDYQRAGGGWIDLGTPDIRGNYVILKHGEQRYTLYAHLRQGSVAVRVGEHVHAGQPLGACGHSGHSSEPHLHFQLQDRADFFSAISLPIRFADFESIDERGGQAVRAGYLQRDQIVQHGADDAAMQMEPVAMVRPSFVDLIASLVQLGLSILGIVVILRYIITFALHLL